MLSIRQALKFVLVATALALVASCDDSGSPSEVPPRDGEELAPPPRDFVVIDGRHPAGTPGFFFLPPLASRTRRDGTFDPSQPAAVEVCIGRAGSGPCERVVERFERRDGRGIPRGRVAVAGDSYWSFWRVGSSDVEVGEPHRIRVVVDGRLLGEMDVVFWRRFRDLRGVDLRTTRAIFRNGVVPIRFWIAQGAVEAPDPGQADLTVASVDPGATEVPVGGLLEVAATVENAGDADAGASELLLVVENSADDTEITRITVAQSSLAAGASETSGASFQSDDAWPASVHVRVVADVGGTVAESDEANNRARSGAVAIRRPDLIPGQITPSSQAVAVGELLEVSGTVVNIGGAPSGASDARIAVEDAVDGQAVVETVVTVPALGAGEGGAVSASFSPTPDWPESVFVVVTADVGTAVTEEDEENNRGTSQPLPVTRADLAVGSLSVPPSLDLGGNLSVSAGITNLGTAASGEFDVVVRVRDQAGNEIASSTSRLGSLDPGASGTASATFLSDAAWLPSVQVEIQLDSADEIDEADESNNSRSAGVALDQANLFVTEVRGPSAAPVGGELAVEADVSNDGTAPAPATDAMVRVVSANDGAELVRAVVSQPAVDPGATVTLAAAFTAEPGWPATVRLEVRADQSDAILESDESDNEGASSEVSITRPNLTVTEVRPVASVAVGSSLAVEVDVGNAGSAPAPETGLRVRVLSQPGGEELTAVVLPQPALAPGSGFTVTTSFTAAGFWPDAVVVEATTDASGTVHESEEGDNQKVSGAVTVTRPNLTVPAIRAAESLSIGASLAVEVDVLNAGTGPAASTQALIRILSGSDGTVLATATQIQPALAPAETVTLSAAFTVDPAWPTTVVAEGISDVSDAVGEGEESDNSARSGSIAILSPDLTVVGIGAESTSVVAQCSVDISGVIRNSGNGGAGDTDLRLSLRAAGGGEEFASRTLAQPALAPGGAHGFTVGFTAEPSWPARVAVHLLTDAGETVLESNETNNAGVADQELEARVGPPAGFTKLWICGANDQWTTSENWQPVGVPTAADDVFIPGGASHAPRLLSDSDVSGITIEEGASLVANGRRLTASGHVSSALMTEPGTLRMTGNGVTLQGTVPVLDLQGQVRLAGKTTVHGTATVNRSARIEVGGQRLETTAGLVVNFDDGRTDGLSMVDPADEVVVGGNVLFRTFSAAAHNGPSLTAGTLRLRGDLNTARAGGASHTAFVSTGTRVVMDGTVRQALSLLGHASGNSSVHDLHLTNTVGGVVLFRDLHVTGELTLVSGATLDDPGGQDVFLHASLPDFTPGYEVLDTHVVGDIALLRDDELVGGGNLRIDPGGRLRLDSHRLGVGGSVVAQFNDGRSDGLLLLNPADELDVAGNLTLRGLAREATTQGSFMEGVIRVAGDLSAIPLNSNQSHAAFVSTGTTVHMDGPGPQQIALGNDSRVHDLAVENTSPDGLRLARDLQVTGQLTMVGASLLTNAGNPAHDVFYHALMPITGPGYDIDHTTLIGPVVMDRDAELPNARNNLLVERSGSLVLGGHRLDIAGDLRVNLYTEGVEGIRMGPGDVMAVQGNLHYDGRGGSSKGQLADGVIFLEGNFTHTHQSGSREVFVSEGTTVVFAGDGTPQVIAGHTPQRVGGDGSTIPGSRFSDMSIAEGAFVDFGLSSFASTSATWITGNADWAGTMERRDSDLDNWVVVQGTLILRDTFSGLSNAPVCYGALVLEGGVLTHDTAREEWTPLQQLGTGDCRK